jgi:2-phospho-L-lactate transferase/gluconeogenesis factor (CofD/UPF0052 family)
MTKKQSHAIYMKVKRDLKGKTIRVWGKQGTVKSVHEHYGQGAACIVNFDNGTSSIIHPTIDQVEIVETSYELPLEALLPV